MQSNVSIHMADCVCAQIVYSSITEQGGTSVSSGINVIVRNRLHVLLDIGIRT